MSGLSGAYNEEDFADAYLLRRVQYREIGRGKGTLN